MNNPYIPNMIDVGFLYLNLISIIILLMRHPSIYPPGHCYIRKRKFKRKALNFAEVRFDVLVRNDVPKEIVREIPIQLLLVCALS